MEQARQDTLRKIHDFLKALDAEPAAVPNLEEELYHIPPDHAKFRLDIVEEDKPPENLWKFEMKVPGRNLAYFTDGIQRTQMIGVTTVKEEGFVRHVPIHYVIVVAIILRRDSGKFTHWRGPIAEEFVVLPEQYFPQKEILGDFRSRGLEILDTQSQGKTYAELRRDAVDAAKRERHRIEHNLLLEWTASRESKGHDYLAVDGSILNESNSDLGATTLGINKSSTISTYTLRSHIDDLLLHQYERSKIFMIYDAQDKDKSLKYSWFLRFRESVRKGPEFGTVRVEVPLFSEREDHQYVIQEANDLSHRILWERFPTSFPYAKWDKLIYPIRLCTEYLRSITLNPDTIQSYFGRR